MNRSIKNKQWGWLAPVLLFAPLLLGAKGCDPAVVGEDCELDAAGKCVPTDPPAADACGGLAGLACDQGEYCKFTPEALCGAADQTGVCSAIPQGCHAIFDPVCGCDDKTYGSECLAAQAGVAVASKGECKPGTDPGEQLCGGIAGLACDRGEYCDFPLAAKCGAADQTGVCKTLPEACEDIYLPVCGCDDKTYGNACEAAALGVSVAYEGKCLTTTPPDEPNACGGLLGLQCERGEYCQYSIEAQCGAADQTGVCSPIPQACDASYAAVCGCDGRTYGNQCIAALAGVSIAAKGECKTSPPPGATCGGLKGLTCARDEYCNYPADAFCGRADATGTCAAVPRGCTKEFKPVCGCDGVTYGNACMAAAAGVSVEYAGECKPTTPPPSGSVCGGFAGAACAKGQYCFYAPDAQCGAADQTGICRPMPEVCTDDYTPVCGCDDKTYSNACNAAAAGVSVVSAGECP